MATVTPNSTFKGWQNDPDNSALNFVYNGTTIGAVSATGLAVTGTFGSSGALTVTSGGLTVTAGGLTVTAGGAVVTAGDAAITAGNVRLGAISAFGTTEPTSAVVMKSGTAPAGAIATSGGVFSSDTVVRKIIADGTASNVET